MRATDLGINEPGVRNYADSAEMLDFNQMLRTRVAYQSDSDAVPVARIEGITSAGIFMTGGVITGDVPLMNLDGWTWERKPRAAGGGHGADVPGRWRRRTRWRRRWWSRGWSGAAPTGLQAVETLITQARAYGANPNRQMDWTLEPLVPVVTKKVPFFVQAGNEATIRSAISWAERQGVNIVIRTNPAAAVATAALLKQKGVPVILSTILSLPQGDECVSMPRITRPRVNWPRRASCFAFSSGGYETSRLVPFQAAMSVAWGLESRRGDQGIDDQRGEDFWRRQDHRQSRSRQGRAIWSSCKATRSRFVHAFETSSSPGATCRSKAKQTELFKRYMGRQ
jgi:hypothetical protein